MVVREEVFFVECIYTVRKLVGGVPRKRISLKEIARRLRPCVYIHSPCSRTSSDVEYALSESLAAEDLAARVKSSEHTLGSFTGDRKSGFGCWLSMIRCTK